MMLKKVKSTLVTKMKESPLAWRLARSCGISSHGAIAGRQTDICVEGFESSANSYTLNVIRYVGDDLSIAHHCHTAASVKVAVEHGVPTVVLFRDPEDAIPSVVSRFRPGVYEATVAYTSFYKTVMNLVDDIILVSFDEATSRTEEMIKKVKDLTAVKFNDYESIQEVDQAVKQHIKEWKAKSQDPSTTPLPTAEREKKKGHVREKMHRLPEYNQAANMYQQVCAAYETQQQRIHGNA
jgi:hypothetical protein